MDWFSTSRTSGTKRQYAETGLDTHEDPRRPRDFRVAAETTRSRSQSPDYPQLPPMIVADQQYRLTRQYSEDSLYSGAIEGCSRDHHPECYPELWDKINKTDTNGPATRLQTPPPYPPIAPFNTPSPLASLDDESSPGGHRNWRQIFS